MSFNFDLLSKGIAELNLDVKNEALETLGRYIDDIEKWNPTHSLVGAAGDELVIKHVLDSLSAVAVIANGKDETIADVGSGGGLPGIPLAIALHESSVTLIERMGSRVEFLKHEKGSLNLDNIEILEREAEKVLRTFDVVTFRAFRPFSETKLFRKVFRLVAPGGRLVAYKGRREKAEGELESIREYASEIKIIPISVPFLDEERCLVVATKG